MPRRLRRILLALIYLSHQHSNVVICRWLLLCSDRSGIAQWRH